MVVLGIDYKLKSVQIPWNCFLEKTPSHKKTRPENQGGSFLDQHTAKPCLENFSNYCGCQGQEAE